LLLEESGIEGASSSEDNFITFDSDEHFNTLDTDQGYTLSTEDDLEQASKMLDKSKGLMECKLIVIEN